MAVKGLDIFKLSPKKNCKDCGSPTCMAFCMKVAQGALPITKCPYMSEEAIALLSEATAPPLKTIEFAGHKLGGETVMFRHEKTLVSRNLFAQYLCTCMDDAEVDAKLDIMKKTDYERIGEREYVESIFVHDAGDADKFVALAKKAATFERGVILDTENVDAAKAAVRETGRKYMVCFSERLQSESAVYAGQLIEQGAIGRVLQVLGMGPHRLNASSRPAWFFERARYGGILCDIGSHQIEQFLYYTGATDAKIIASKIANYNHPEYPELDDFGDATLVGNNGATGYFRVDWFTPDGLRTWGDGRTFILGTEGYIELRKYLDVTREGGGDHVFWVDNKGEHYFDAAGKVGFPYFGKLVLDCISRTENAMTQEHAFKAAELCVRAQLQAVKVE